MSTAPTLARDHVSVHELTTEYPVSPAYVYREIREGRLPYLRFGRRVVVSRREFEEHARRAAELHVSVEPK